MGYLKFPPLVTVKVTLRGDGDFFDLFEILEGLKVNKRQVQEIYIAVGCN